jgi:peptidoglycan DL-endopeptidase CwlO
VPKKMPALATRFAVTATATAAAALIGMLPNAAGPAHPAAPEAVPQATTPTTTTDASPAETVPTVTVPVVKAAYSAPSAAVRASAVSRALSKLGAPYVWGATGPSAFDCSGLVDWAYRSVGVSLPRTSQEQSDFGIPVSKNALRPGDLVFFYTPVQHVGMYIGGGKVVNAQRPGTPVKISSINSMPFHSARRV